MAEWDDFEARLARGLRNVVDRVFLIVAHRDDPLKYVQFTASAERLDAEAAGRGVEALADPAALGRAGWQPPRPAEKNWTFALPRPALTSEYRQLAARCVLALRDVQRIATPDVLVQQAWRDAEDPPPGVTLTPELRDQLEKAERPYRIPALKLPPQS